MKRHYEMLRMKEDTTADERAEANTYLDRAGRFGRETEADIAEHLHAMRDEGGLDGHTADEVDAIARDAGYNSQAQFIVHNPPGTNAQTFLQKVMIQADHSNGASYSNSHNTSMRLLGQAAKQRASNTRLDSAADLHNLGDRGRDGGRSSGGFSSAELNEAIRLSLQSRNNADASNLSYESRSRSFSSDMNATTMRSLEQDYSNHSRDSFSLGNTFHQNSNMSSTPYTGPYKTAESQEDTSPEHVKNCRPLMLDASMDSDLEDEDRQVACHALKSLTRPYDPPMVHFAQRIDQKYGDNPAKATKKLTDAFKTLKKC